MTNKNERTHFKFYKSYYDVFCELKNDKEKIAFIDAIFNKQFFNIEVELEGMAKFAYISQKHNIENQVQGFIDMKGKFSTPYQGPTDGPKQGPIEGPYQEQIIDNRQQIIDNIEYSQNPELNTAIGEWITYKKEKKEGYKSTGLKSFLTQCHSHTPASVITQMRRAMSNGWKGIVWENCAKIPKFNTEYDFSDANSYNPDEWRKALEQDPTLWEQLEYQNKPLYTKFKKQVDQFNSLLS